MLTGTPAYFAPETARGEGTDARSDVYSLGATLYAAVEGHPPFGSGDGNVLALLARIGQGRVPAPQRAGPLGELLRHLTADDPAARALWLCSRRASRCSPSPSGARRLRGRRRPTKASWSPCRSRPHPRELRVELGHFLAVLLRSSSAPV